MEKGPPKTLDGRRKAPGHGHPGPLKTPGKNKPERGKTNPFLGPPTRGKGGGKKGARGWREATGGRGGKRAGEVEGETPGGWGRQGGKPSEGGGTPKTGRRERRCEGGLAPGGGAKMTKRRRKQGRNSPEEGKKGGRGGKPRDWAIDSPKISQNPPNPPGERGKKGETGGESGGKVPLFLGPGRGSGKKALGKRERGG